jgi:hypothetical protein
MMEMPCSTSTGVGGNGANVATHQREDMRLDNAPIAADVSIKRQGQIEQVW